jgi:hypothetical protein
VNKILTIDMLLTLDDVLVKLGIHYIQTVAYTKLTFMLPKERRKFHYERYHPRRLRQSQSMQTQTPTKMHNSDNSCKPLPPKIHKTCPKIIELSFDSTGLLIGNWSFCIQHPSRLVGFWCRLKVMWRLERRTFYITSLRVKPI